MNRNTPWITNEEPIFPIGLAAGTYYYELSTGNLSQTKKITIL